MNDDDPPEWSLVCPKGGVHQVERREVIWVEIEPDHVIPERACVKCGLRDTFIEESE
jgi:hypothetical protein